jgi:hypothetical protein
MDEVDMTAYRKALAAWEKERLRQQVEFTITEHDLHADDRLTPTVEYMVS